MLSDSLGYSTRLIFILTMKDCRMKGEDCRIGGDDCRIGGVVRL